MTDEKKESTELVKTDKQTKDLERFGKLAEAAVNGNLAKMSLAEKASFLSNLALAEGIPAFPRPWIIVQDKKGKETLVSTKARAEALRARDKVSIKALYEGALRLGEKFDPDFFECVYEASTAEGRTDTDRGITFIGGLQGQEKADKIMSAITKGKNRVTYSITGCGGLDETEAADSMGAKNVEVLPAGPRKIIPQFGNPTQLTTVEAEPIFQDMNNEQMEGLAPISAPVSESNEPMPPVGAPKVG